MNNTEQIDFWNGDAGTSWVKEQEQLDRTLAPLSKIVIQAAEVSPGERGIDIGCGCGSTTLELADQGASVWGVDVSEPMLAHAKARAAGREDVRFSCADASTAEYTPDHDFLFSRFGVMFFADPAAAFTQLRTALNDSGRMIFLCWRTPAENPWMSVPGGTIRPFLEDPPTPDPLAPGPFAFADRDRLDGILRAAGFSQFTIDEANADFRMADDLESGLESLTTSGPMARTFQAIPSDRQSAASDALREAIAPFVSSQGLVFKAGAWLVRARR